MHYREQLVFPSHGAYLPWSEEHHACPGKKFARVEHAAVAVAIFRDHCVAPLRHSRESQEVARERAAASMRDTGMHMLHLKGHH